ncbi:MAG: carboxypeptidase regulatory-like domain-containing protein [Terriglobia bacterium]
MVNRTDGGAKLAIAGLFVAFLFCASGASYAQRLGGLRGRVVDPSGAVVPAAVVVVTAQHQSSPRQVTTNRRGLYDIAGLAPGRYTVTASAPGFARLTRKNVVIGPGQGVVLDLRLTISSETQQVVVRGRASHLEVAPQSNASAVVISGASLAALSNDPDELQNQLTALAGPSVGPGGGEIYIDGFTRGDLPPKSAIREIRVNSNPFSVENDRLGYGRIDIFTKPGSAAWHGSASAEYNDSSMNALSPFLATATTTPPAYHTWLFNGDVGGPLGRKSSFFFDMDRRNINRANLVNTDVLSPSLNIEPYVASVTNPRVLTNISPRFDFQLTPRNTLTVNYRYSQIGERNNGVDTQSLPSQAYDAARRHHELQLFDNQVLSANVVNQTRFQYLHFHNWETPLNFAPTINVLGAFAGGGDSSGLFQRYETHYEFQNYTSLTLNHHLVQFGGFVRDIRRRENTNGNFNGTFTFNSLADYQQTERSLTNGLTMAQIQAAGYGPSQFNITAGKLSAAINRLDGALFAGDDWTVTPHFTASAGLRFESENVISDHADWAPRVGIAWGLGHGSNVKTVLRAGWGMFYQRLDDDQMIIAARLNGQNQRTYIVNNPTFFPVVPPVSQLTASAASLPTIYRISPNLRSPYDMDTAVSLERQLTRNTAVSVTYLNSRGVAQFLTNDINAPLPGTFIPGDPTSGVRPLGDAAGNIYQYESEGIYRQSQLIANVHVRAGDRLSLFGYYVYNDAHSDTAGINSFATNPWNIMQDYGRAAFGVRHRALIGGSFAAPFGLRLSSIVMANSGLPFGIMLGQDIYGTGIHNARPAFATPSTPPADLALTPYGAFNTAPAAGNIPIPPYTENAPGNFILNLRLSRTFGFGGTGGRRHGGEGAATAVEHEHHRRGLGGRGLAGTGGGFSLGGATEQRFAVTFSVSALNVFNNVNLAPPVNVLGSPLFGHSIALAGGPFSAQVGNPVANRLINVGITFSF